jgi:hypothetical protein
VIAPLSFDQGRRAPIPAGSSSTRLAANTSTCTPTRGPSDGWHGPATGPLAGSVKRGPVPIGRASLSRARGIDAVAAGRADGDADDPQADTTAAPAVTRTAARTARATRAAITGTNRSYDPGTPAAPGGTYMT